MLLFIALVEYRFQTLSLIQPAIDIAFFAFMIYAGSEDNSGFVVLMALVSILSPLLIRHRIALLYSIGAVFALTLALWWRGETGLDKTAAHDLALQAFSILTVSLLGNILARRLTHYESEVVEQSHSIQDIRQLNSEIINTMKRGLLVINEHKELLYINNRAWHLLASPNNPIGKHLKQISYELSEQLQGLKGKELEGTVFKATKVSPRLLPRFVKLSNDKNILITLEDYAETSKKIQQAKLASLGQLTASIAHEIRNPLNAINQASQLLEESLDANGQDNELQEIIQRQIKRINGIIENIQQVSKRKAPTRTQFVLDKFLTDFITEFKQGTSFEPDIVINKMEKNLLVQFDLAQLKQVICNLFENGLFFSHKKTGQHKIHLTAGHDPRSQRLYLDITDQGKGIAVNEIEKVFEPFYTTNHEGTGLGLYISRELCEANGAQLDCIPVASGACFRVTFDQGLR